MNQDSAVLPSFSSPVGRGNGASNVGVPHAKNRYLAAKWPPDDTDELPSGGSVGGGGASSPGGGGDDEDFRKGAIKPSSVLIGAAIVIGAAVAAVFALKGEGEKLSKEEVAVEMSTISRMPKAEQLPKWQAWAKRDDVPSLQQEAFVQLAWAKDLGSVPTIAAGLKSVDHRVRGTAAQALAEIGLPGADSAKPALLKAFEEGDSSDKPQIAWALTVLKESSALDGILGEYRAGHLAKVQRLDESPAFDPEALAGLVSLEKLSEMAKDESESLRQLVATALSRSADPKFTESLIKLVRDPQVEVAREAAVGLGKIANEEAMGPLLEALAKADKGSRQKFLEALRDGVGGKGLVLALKSVSHESADREKYQTKQIFDMLRELADPRAGEELVKYLGTGPKPHWRTEAALRLAEIGDVRAVPHLAWRMAQDPLQLYSGPEEVELRQDDNERVVSARMLSDLAILYPDKLAEIRKDAAAPVLAWAVDKPQPHANALRFLAAAHVDTAAAKLRQWANPTDPLPKEGQQGFPDAWATAQSALRYLGWMKDPSSWGILESQLNRRPAKVDATMESLGQGGLAVLGMTLRALGVGAADGMAQWGDPKGYGSLTKYIEDPMNNEQSRIEACFALAWVATDAQMKEVVTKVKSFNKPDPKSAFVRGCYLETLVRKPVSEATSGLVELLRPEEDMEVRHQAARAIAAGGVSASVASVLQGKLSDPSLRADAVLALLLGADADTASRAVLSYNDGKPEELEELKTIYNQTFGYWSDVNFEKGDVARWIENAQAVSRVRVFSALQDWPRLILARGLQGIDFDNGPHSMTRVQFRVRLVNAAKGADAVKRDQAIEILKFMREKGVLMALRNEPGVLGDLAKKAYFEVMNPKATVEQIPEAKKADLSSVSGAGSKAR